MTATPSDVGELLHHAREARVRGALRKEGLALHRSRSRNPEAYDFGTYQVVDISTNFIVQSSGPGGVGLDLDDIEHDMQEN